MVDWSVRNEEKTGENPKASLCFWITFQWEVKQGKKRHKNSIRKPRRTVQKAKWALKGQKYMQNEKETLMGMHSESEAKQLCIIEKSQLFLNFILKVCQDFSKDMWLKFTSECNLNPCSSQEVQCVKQCQSFHKYILELHQMTPKNLKSVATFHYQWNGKRYPSSWSLLYRLNRQSSAHHYSQRWQQTYCQLLVLEAG